MKKITLTLIALFIYIFSIAEENPNQDKIDAAFMQSFATQSDQIEPIIAELRQNENENAYWIAYGQFYSAIYYMHTGKKDQARKSTDAAIELLEKIEKKNSEEHALLGYILGFSVSLDPSSAARISAKAASQYKAALKKDENNLRAYLGMGESDYYKPAEYGGGEKVEEYLLKAISLPDQSVENGPSWGKNSAYYTLASFYKREDEIDKAKMYCMKGLNEFPQDYQLNQLKQSF